MNSALKNVAVTAFASEALEGETWEGMCRYAVEAIKNGGTHFTIRIEMKAVEKQMKADYDVTAMPSAWRSAKSVVLGAVAEAVDLMKGSAVLGKTDVETRIKAARISAGKAPAYTYLNEYMKVAKLAEKFWGLMTTEQQDAVESRFKWNIE